jgi:hypothetical protein
VVICDMELMAFTHDDTVYHMVVFLSFTGVQGT